METLQLPRTVNVQKSYAFLSFECLLKTWGTNITNLIMDKKMKNHYQVPTIKVVAFKVEEGFVGSPDKSANVVERFEGLTQQESRSWTASDYVQTGEQTVFGSN